MSTHWIGCSQRVTITIELRVREMLDQITKKIEESTTASPTCVLAMST